LHRTDRIVKGASSISRPSRARTGHPAPRFSRVGHPRNWGQTGSSPHCPPERRIPPPCRYAASRFRRKVLKSSARADHSLEARSYCGRSDFSLLLPRSIDNSPTLSARMLRNGWGICTRTRQNGEGVRQSPGLLVARRQADSYGAGQADLADSHENWGENWRKLGTDGMFTVVQFMLDGQGDQSLPCRGVRNSESLHPPLTRHLARCPQGNQGSPGANAAN
jgi:hypothetical protein